MSNNRDLLNEAIADAKSVKEAAIANAKAALEESFAPYLAEKLKQKIAQLDEEEAYEGKEMQKEKKELEEKMPDSMMRKDSKMSEMDDKRMKEAYMDEEMNLDELLAELEEEMKNEEYVEEEAETLNEEEEVEIETEEDEIDLEDMSEEDLKALIEDVIGDMVKAGEIEAGENFQVDDEMDMKMDMKMEANEKNIDEMYGGGKDDIPSRMRGKMKKDTAEEEGKADYERSKKRMKEESDGKMDENMMNKVSKFIQRVKDNAAAGRPLIDDEMFSFIDKTDVFPANFTANVRKEEKDLEEMDDQIKELTSTLNEVKLLNAKLLYTNKIFRAKNLTENQKIKVLHAFDKASSVRETKLVFETLQTELKEKKAYVNESIRGLASKRAGVAPTTKQPILESNEQVTRWQKLAGIIKS